MAKRGEKKDPNVTERMEKLPDGRVQFVDTRTGEVKAIQGHSKKNKARIAQGKKPHKIYEFRKYAWKENKNRKMLLVPAWMDATDLPNDYVHFRDDEAMRLNVCQMVAEGATIQEVSEIETMPPRTVILNWYLKDEKFRSMMQEARKIRAENMRDDVYLAARDVTEKNAKSTKVKTDILLRLMGYDDRERFGEQTKVIGTAQPTVLIIDTGLGVLDAIPTEGKVIDGQIVRSAITESVDGIHPSASTARDPQEPQEVQCSSVSQEVRQECLVHQCTDPRLPEE